ncbi:hypothetical protein MPH_03717 [Macrophomina phaseolina MS6]|uniref:Uncharacterized protein n=1 Tax=Macrophomina phaseolina (strain MS6) TaxID=1126212 RepID=K2S217_MACPH|nr:hypothetical protein MPH_03717 [Macrophomina phaseolina MS6]
MGGHAFEPDGLHTPRIPTGLYDQLKKNYAAALAPFYQHTAYAEVLPDKSTHGDVDILAEGPHVTTTTARIAAALNATAYKSNGRVTNYAVPHPTLPGAHVQLDVQLSPPGHLAWQTFFTSYGDLSQILGVVHRPLGLTATDRGLHVRVPEIEPSNKKASMILLTRDPLAVLAFLGLDAARYVQRDFAGETDVFAWVAAARFFDRAKRGMYRRFVDEWVPANLEAGADCKWTREMVLEEALEAFGKRTEYEARLMEHRERLREDALWHAIKETVPRKGESLALVIRGLKRWVSMDGGALMLREEPLPEGKKCWVKELEKGGEGRVLKWVEEHWPYVQIKEKAWATLKKAQGTGSIVDAATQEVRKICLDENSSVDKK